MEKWKFLLEHGPASLTGAVRLCLTYPRFAAALLSRRAGYFFKRQLRQPLETPDQFLIDTPDTLIAYWSMFVEHELYDPLWVGSLQSARQPLVIDVGANAGVFSHFIHWLRPGTEIICFEPLPQMAERIRSWATRTGMNLVCHQEAVSWQKGEAFFESIPGHEGTSKLSQDRESAPGKNVFRVETTTLDEVLQGRKCTVIKIDVEGFECDVLKGGQTTLKNTDYLILEAQTAQHLKEISGSLGPAWQNRKLGSSDYLFFRPNR